MKLHLGDTSYQEFVDAIYSFASENRLNVQWFGWYQTPDAKRWFERSDAQTNFKISMFMLDEKNGYLYVSSNIKPGLANVIIDYGKRNEEWLKVIDSFHNFVSKNRW